MSPRLLSVSTDLPALLGVSRATAYRLVAECRIEHVRIGSRVLVTEAAVDAYIRAQTVPARRFPQRVRSAS